MQNLILYATTVLIWGTTWIAIKFQIIDISPFLSIAYRYAIAAAALALFLLVVGRLKKFTFTRRQYFFAAMQGFFLFFVSYYLTYEGAHYLTSGLIAVVFSTIPVMNIFNQAVFFGIKVSRQVIYASALGTLGIAAIFWPEIQNAGQHIGVITGALFVLGGVYFASIGNILSQRNSKDGMDVLETNLIGMTIGAIFAFAAALVTDAEIKIDTSPSYIISLLYLGIFGSSIAFGTYMTLIKRIGAARAGYSAVLFPIVALGISTVFRTVSNGRMEPDDAKNQ